MNANDYDVLIIGGGPAGATAALYTARAELRTLVLDKSMTAGALGITKQIANYPGVPEVITGEELLTRMRNQAKQYGAVFEKAKVVAADIAADPKIVTTSDGRAFTARAVILATGAMGRSKTLPGEEEFLGRGVSYCATCDGAFFKNRDVAVVGHNAEAVEEALFLTRYVRKLYVFTPKPALEAPAELLEELRAKPQVELRLGERATRIVGNGSVTGVTVSGGPGRESELPVHGVFIFTQGSRPIVDYLAGAVAVSEQGCVPVSRDFATPIAGVFACGDVLCNDVQQAVVAAAQGCVAALAADRYLNKRKAFSKDYK